MKIHFKGIHTHTASAFKYPRSGSADIYIRAPCLWQYFTDIYFRNPDRNGAIIGSIGIKSDHSGQTGFSRAVPGLVTTFCFQFYYLDTIFNTDIIAIYVN